MMSQYPPIFKTLSKVKNRRKLLNSDIRCLPKLIDISVIATFGLLQIRLLWRLVCKFCAEFAFISGSYGTQMFNFLRHCQMVFQSDGTILLQHQKQLRVPVPPYPNTRHYQSFLFYLFQMVRVVVSHGGFN